MERIHDVLRQAQHGEDAELIDLYPPANLDLTLLRSKKFPTAAFLIWSVASSGTLSLISLRLLDGGASTHFRVFCGCCSSEHKIEAPHFDDDEVRLRWRRLMTAQFKESLASTCISKDIKTVFIRKADRWDTKYGILEGVTFCEALDHGRFFTGQKTKMGVAELYPFIDYPHSQGLRY